MIQFAMVAMFALGAVAPDLPDYLKQLAPVWENETELVAQLRAFDKERQESIKSLIKSRQQPGEPVPAEPPQDVAKNIQEMAAEIRKGYELALESYGQNAKLHNYYGEVLYDLFGESAAAVKEWNLAIANDEKLAGPYNNLALHQFTWGEYEMGLKNLDLALKYDKENPDYLFNVSNLYMIHFPQIAKLRKWKESKVYEEAMKASKKAVKLSPDDYDLLADYALNFFKAEDFKLSPEWKEASEAWVAARAKARTDEERFYCWMNEARVRMRDKDNTGAKACIQEALGIRPTSEVAQNLLAKIEGGKEDQ